MIKAFLFDLDGTLLDTTDDLTAATNAVLNYYKRPSITRHTIEASIYKGTLAIIDAAFDSDLTMLDKKRLNQQIFQSYQIQMGRNSAFISGMLEFLDHLDRKQLPWGIVTNKPLWLAQPLLLHHRIYKRCQVLLGAESLPVKKPHPEPLLYAANRLGIPPQQCAYLGDAPSDIIAANHANMTSLLAAFSPSHPNEQRILWGADKIIYDAHQLYMI